MRSFRWDGPPVDSPDPEPDLTRAEIVEALHHLNHEAKRQMRVVGSDDFPTPWDRRHRSINDRLDELA